MRIWTEEEIEELPQFGADNGWFYGLVKYGGKTRIREILPGLGHCNPWPLYHLKSWYLVIEDILKS